MPIFISSLVSTSALMVLLAMIDPKIFSLIPGAVPPDSLAQQPESSMAITQPNSDSVQSQQIQNVIGMTPLPDSSSPLTEINPQMLSSASPGNFSKNELHDLAKAEVKRSGSSPNRIDTLSESEKKKMVQIFESMDAESAVRILNNMDDYAVKQVLTAMKRRQSAKILAAFEPQQAARILNGRIQQ